MMADLNPPLKGWFGYFQHAWRTIFPDLDQFVWHRLRAVLRRQHQLASRHGHSPDDHRRWPNAFVAE